MKLLISRNAARSLGLKRYFTGKPCKRGHFSERFVANKACFQCSSISTSIWQKSNPIKVIASSRAWQENNFERCIANHKAWSKSNPDKANAIAARRYASKLNATPSWVNLEAIAKIYKIASELNRTIKKRDEKYHVDHIIPLKNPFVCGLHVEYNLQLLTARENLKKHNIYIGTP